MDTYRFIRFTKEPVQKKSGVEDIVKVYYDIDTHPSSTYDIEGFLSLLEEQYHLAYEHPALLIDIKDALLLYEIHFILDTKKMSLSTMERAKDKIPSLKEEMAMGLSKVMDPRNNRNEKDNAMAIGPNYRRSQNFINRIGMHSLN